MKKNVCYLLLFFTLFMTGCSASLQGISSILPWNISDKSVPTPTSNESVAIENVNVYDAREYGEADAIIDNGNFLHCYLLYPKTGLPEIDRIIYNWADSVYFETKKNIYELHDKDPSVIGEINAQYNAYLINEAYAGVEEAVFYTHSQLDAPVEFVKAFNIDLARGQLIENYEIINPEYTDDVLGLLTEQILIRYPDFSDQLAYVDAAWLEKIALTRDGVDVILDSDKFLPSYPGVHIFKLTYESLGDALVLGRSSSDLQNTSDLILADAEQAADSSATTDASASSKPQTSANSADLFPRSQSSLLPDPLRPQFSYASDIPPAQAQSQPAQAQPQTPPQSKSQPSQAPQAPTPAQAPQAQPQTPPESQPAPAQPQTPPQPESQKRWIDPEKPMVALTFDDGPSKFTPRIIELLAQSEGRATFCVVGGRVEAYSDTIKQAVAQGSEVIGHSWDHKQFTRLTGDELRFEISATNKAIYNVTGIMPTMYRPPYGSVNSAVSAISQEMGMSIVNWSIDTLDWKKRKSNSVYNAIMSKVTDGSIVLCHDLYGSTADAMERVIPELTAQGYQLVTLSELFSFSKEPLVAGGLYNRR
ncbi:MAG: polysaccharide deacetylase family protein [Clostridiales Family XIII bacterium]|jgi:peptidoglycan/xylan/chitin deacetylase (PgdA/CDA1 family)|nr:polysaccharide deacetylase family protein [Clostridiales Family XIII bacterium]